MSAVVTVNVGDPVMPVVCPAGLVSVSVGAWVSGPDDATVTETADELPTPPLLSVARAVSECAPVTVGVQLNE